MRGENLVGKVFTSGFAGLGKDSISVDGEQYLTGHKIPVLLQADSVEIFNKLDRMRGNSRLVSRELLAEFGIKIKNLPQNPN